MYGCVAFCLLSSAVAFFFSVLMGWETLATFTIPAVENKWDLQQKAGACRNAGFMYLFVAAALTAKTLYGTPKSREERVHSYGVDASEREASPLLNAGSTPLSDSNASSFDRIPQHHSSSTTTHRRAVHGGLYGAIEMKVIDEE